MHWPAENIFVENKLKMLFRFFSFFAIIFISKLKRIKILWTAHNASTHDKNYPSLEKIFWRFFTKHIDGYVIMSNASKEVLVSQHPELKKKKYFLIPHGHYKDYYPNEISKQEAKIKLSIENDKIVLLFVGHIRRYKNIISLINEFTKIKDNNLVLVIAGDPEDQQMQEQIIKYSDNDNRIKLYLSEVKGEDFQIFFNSADIVILPYTNILNSGMVLLSLSFARPVLIGNYGSVPEYQKIIGENWIKIFNNKITEYILIESIDWIKKRNNDECKNIDNLSWDRIANMTLNAYKEILSD